MEFNLVNLVSYVRRDETYSLRYKLHNPWSNWHTDTIIFGAYNNWPE